VNHEGNALLAKHLPVLRTWAGQLCRSTVDAEDLVQDTAARALAALPSYEHRGHPAVWLFVIMRSAYVNQKRRRRIRARLEPQVRLHALLAVPEESAADRDASERLHAAMQSLDDVLRLPLEMHLVEERSYQEIALRLDLPVGTVGTRLMRAKRLVRMALEGEVEERAEVEPR
jgi:RNA polymerase sigma-70 factor (ECF subfamily)